MIKRILLLFFLLFLNQSFPQQLTYFIKYKSNVTPAAVSQKVKSQKVFEASEKGSPGSRYFSVNYFAGNLASEDENLARIIKVSFQSSSDAEEFLNRLAADNSIEYVQPQNIYRVDVMPDDSLVADQWALKKINAFQAWNITAGADSVLLAIIDTGIEFFHPDLRDNIFFNPGESGSKSSNGIDDDGNGFVDDYMGWDFTDRFEVSSDTSAGDFTGWDNYPYDAVQGGAGYHGTFVAGIAGARYNNHTGIAGAAPNIKLLNLRAFDNSGNGDEDDAAAAIIYAVKMGAKVINMSWGDYTFSYVLRDVIRYAYSHNVVLVASSGNSGSSTQLVAPHYPSGYSEVISVGNSTEDDYRAMNSVYGQTLDLVAPGTNILSTNMGSGYLVTGGTSAAAPFVSAAASLILSVDNFTNDEVKQIIKSTTDDVDAPGWDIQTGAGRLNLFKALQILSPGKVSINYPKQDFATSNDTIKISVTAMSPYFVSYSLQYGEGLNPREWKTIVDDQKYQVQNKEIFTLQTQALNEGDYTLKLMVSLNNGRTTEERINFHLLRANPEITLSGAGPAYVADKSTIMGEVYTDQLSTARMYYRIKGTGVFSFVTMDGFSASNQFVQQKHYGFIPYDAAAPSSLYEVYFEAENLAGLKTVLKQGNGSYFEFTTDPLRSSINYSVLPYSLPSGTIFEKPLNFLSGNNNEVLFKDSDFKAGSDSIKVKYTLLKLVDTTFVKIDSLLNREPVDAGDFNNNGKLDLLSVFNLNELKSYIDEQPAEGAFSLQNKLTLPYKSSLFYPVLVADLNSDGLPEIYTNYYDSLTRIWNVNPDLQVNKTDSVKNYSFIYPEDKQQFGLDVNVVYRNSFVAADADGDGKKELWLVDKDADLISFRYTANGFQRGDSLIERYLHTTSEKILASGDLDGDGTDEIAVLYSSDGIAPYYLLRILNFKGRTSNILYEKVFVDMSSNSGFNFTEYHQTIKFVDLDNDKKDELILNIFPNAYIIKYTSSGPSVIFYEKGINTENIFSGDLNRNGVVEIALQNDKGFKFYEFTPPVKPEVPSFVQGYSLTGSIVHLQWSGESERYLVYKGTAGNNISLYDSTAALMYEDKNVSLNTNYYYAVNSVDRGKQIPVSELSNIIEVYSHIPAKALSAGNPSIQSVNLLFSGRVKNTINDLSSFEIAGLGIPNSAAPSSESSYLLTFSSPLKAGENKVIVKGLKDYYGSPIDNDTLAFVVSETPLAEEFFISSYEIMNPYRIKIVFNLQVNEPDAVNINNYSLEPGSAITGAYTDPADKHIVFLDLAKTRPVGALGREYILRVKNLVSATGIRINEGAGSYVVLAASAKDLSDVYVYPSPVKLVLGTEKMTFANLPSRARITILTLNGKQVKELEETDGNGGIEYDLRDNSGSLLNSGIYIYRVIHLDNSNNEVEEKLGKFVIIR